MNPPLEPLSDKMFSELLAEIRVVRQEIGRVHDSLDAHVRDEMGQYAEVQHQLREMRDDVVSLKTKMGLLAGAVSAVVAAVTAWASRVFF